MASHMAGPQPSRRMAVDVTPDQHERPFDDGDGHLEAAGAGRCGRRCMGGRCEGGGGGQFDNGFIEDRFLIGGHGGDRERW